jgi:hypothetical protein
MLRVKLLRAALQRRAANILVELVRLIEIAVRGKQQSEKLVLNDEYVGDSLKNGIAAHVQAP